MGVLLTLVAMSVGMVYHPEDFHYYNEFSQGRGLERINKLYIDFKQGDKERFLKLSSKIKKLERFQEIKTEDLNGLLLFFNNTKDTIDVLNELLSKSYSVAPVVLYEGIECTHSNEVIVGLQPSINEPDFLNRLKRLANGNFKLTKLSPQVYKVGVDSLTNPSNALILANVIAKDNAWVKYAMIAWHPLDGYIKATASVETGSVTHLGELRKLKIVLTVFDPTINIRSDLLPQMGQGLTPFPFSGE